MKNLKNSGRVFNSVNFSDGAAFQFVLLHDHLPALCTQLLHVFISVLQFPRDLVIIFTVENNNKHDFFLI